MVPSPVLLALVVAGVLLLLAALNGLLAAMSPAAAEWRDHRHEVLFVVSERRWVRILLRSLSLVILIGGVISLVVITSSTRTPPADPTGGAICTVLGTAGVFFVHVLGRWRLAVTPDTVWVFRMMGSPRRVPIADITRLENYASRYGGVQARVGKKKVFAASGSFRQYGRLIDHLSLTTPEVYASWRG